MRISAKADYAVRAVVELAGSTDQKPIRAQGIANAQSIPLNFLENILGELRHAGIVRSHRGSEGGFRLARPAQATTVADVIWAVEGPLASVRGGPPEDSEYIGAAQALVRVWIRFAPTSARCSSTSPSPTSPAVAFQGRSTS